ncbi:chemosensory receptor c [Plakobranchus ocellatus]|uniref:Chemosensory receptor c n=1 Tax=Plakobranchus ocellatus TaxID=259542 RepID=A0AAV4BBY0_9GAST|nr:chemosensory receptor c [Plakobranchus ocellatus]
MESSRADAAPILSDALSKLLIDSFFRPLAVCITTLGIVGNVINIVVFRKRTPMDVMTTCFIALAVSDLLYFCFYVPNFIAQAFIKNGMRILYNVDIHSLVLFTMHYQKSLFNIISIAITAFMAIERSLCVVRPFLVKKLFTRRRVAAILTAIYLCLIALFTPSFLSVEAVWKYPGNKTEPVLMFQRTSLSAVADHIRSLMAGFSLIVVTQVIITISAGLMISGLRRHQHFRQTASSETRRPGKSERTRHKLTCFTLKSSLRKKKSIGTLESISENSKNETKPCCADQQSKMKPSEKMPFPHTACQNAIYATTSIDHNLSSQIINSAEAASSKELRLIKTVLVLAVMHVVLTSPSLIFYVAQNLIPEFGPMKTYNNMFYVAGGIITTSSSLNGMLNTFVYLTLNESILQKKKQFDVGADGDDSAYEISLTDIIEFNDDLLDKNESEEDEMKLDVRYHLCT